MLAITVWSDARVNELRHRIALALLLLQPAITQVTVA